MKYTIALINLASFALAINFPQLNEEATDRMFKRLDGDQNGALSQVEFDRAINGAAGLKFYAGFEKPTFQEVDVNGDGKIDATEFNAYLQVEATSLKADDFKQYNTPELQEHAQKLYKNFAQQTCPEEGDAAWESLQNCKDETCPLFKCVKQRKAAAKNAELSNMNKSELVSKYTKLQGEIAGQAITAAILFIFVILLFVFTNWFVFLLTLPITLGILIGEVFLIRKLVTNIATMRAIKGVLDSEKAQ